MTTLIAVLVGTIAIVAIGCVWGDNLSDIRTEERDKQLQAQLRRISTPVVVVEIKELGKSNAR